MFDNILEVDMHLEGGPGSARCLSRPLKRLAYSRIDLSLLQHQSTYISREAWETQNHQTFSSISLLGTLKPGDRRDLHTLSAACALVLSLMFARGTCAS